MATSKSIIDNTYVYTYTSGMKGKVSFTDKKANWEILEGPAKGFKGADNYEVKKVNEGVYFVRWHEPENKITVTVLINEQTKKVYGSVVSPNGLEFDEAEINEMVIG